MCASPDRRNDCQPCVLCLLRRYFSRVLSTLFPGRRPPGSPAAAPPPALSPEHLAALLAACARVAHPLTASQPGALAAAARRRLPQARDGGDVLRCLSALLWYARRDAHLAAKLLGSSSPRPPPSHAVSPPDVADADATSIAFLTLQPVLEAAGAAGGASPQGEGRAECLVDVGLRHVEVGLCFAGVDAATLATFLSQLQWHGSRLPMAWLDACLLHASAAQRRPRQHAAQGAAAPVEGPGEEEGGGVVRELREARATLALLQALAGLAYQPPASVAEAWLPSLEAALPPALAGPLQPCDAGASTSSPPTTQQPSAQRFLTASEVASAAVSLAALRLRAGPAWCSRALAGVLANSGHQAGARPTDLQA